VTPDPAAPRRRQRAGAGCLLAGIWGGGYFGAQAWLRPVADPVTALDLSLPFVAWTVWIYLAGIAWIAAPLVALRTDALLARWSRRYALALMLALACFVALPCASPALRGQAMAAMPGSWSGAALQLLHHVDGPGNLFPSLHVTLAWLAAAALAAQYPRARAACWLAAAAVAVAVLLCKQHTVADVAAGAALALVCVRLPLPQPGTVLRAPAQPRSRR
jgi:membrane-associated phospholipid phosphatase